MRAFLGVVTGYRDDLALHTRWWHRLGKVAFSIVGALLLAGAGVVAYWSPATPNRWNVRIVETLSGHRERGNIGTTGKSFIEAVHGTLGVAHQNGEIGNWLLASEVADADCARND